MRDRDEEKAVSGVRNTGQGVVPGRKRGDDTKRTARPDQTGHWRATVGAVVEISEAEEEEGHVESEEEDEEGDCGTQRAEQEKEGEDEPAHEEETEDVVEGVCLAAVCGYDVESARGEDDGEGDPETTVGRKGCGTESVADRHFPGMGLAGVVRIKHSACVAERVEYSPHTSQQLDETTVSKRNRNDQVGFSNSAGAQIDERQNESRQCEGRETERRRVGDVALGRAVETRLEGTTKGRKLESGIVGRHVCERVAAVIVGSALLCAAIGVICSCSAISIGAVHTGGFLLVALDVLLKAQC